jgi:hypothetical protein
MRFRLLRLARVRKMTANSALATQTEKIVELAKMDHVYLRRDDKLVSIIVAPGNQASARPYMVKTQELATAFQGKCGFIVKSAPVKLA